MLPVVSSVMAAAHRRVRVGASKLVRYACVDHHASGGASFTLGSGSVLVALLLSGSSKSTHILSVTVPAVGGSSAGQSDAVRSMAPAALSAVKSTEISAGLTHGGTPPWAELKKL